MKWKYMFAVSGIVLALYMFKFLSQPVRKGNVDVKNDNYYTIKITERDLVDTLLLSRYVKNTEYIALETNPKCLIGEIHKIAKANGKLFVLDRLTSVGLFVFDTTGKFLMKIGKKGSENEEYVSPSDFIIDDKQNQVLVLDGQSKSIQFYDIRDGKYLKTQRLSFPASAMEKIDNGYAFYGESHEDRLIITNSVFKRIYSYFPYDKINGVLLLNQFSQTPDSKVLFRVSLCDSIYRVTQQGVELHTIVDFGNLAFTFDKYQKTGLIDEPLKIVIQKAMANYMANLAFYHEYLNTIYFSFAYKNKAYGVIHNKSVGNTAIFSYQHVKNDVTFEPHSPYFIAGDSKGRFWGSINAQNKAIILEYLTKHAKSPYSSRMRNVMQRVHEGSNPIVYSIGFN